MQQGQSLYILQTELINSKVEKEMTRAITPVMDQIILLKQEMTLFRHDMAKEFGAFRKELHTEIDAFRKEIKTEIDVFRKEVKTEIDMFRKEVKTEIDMFRKEVKTEIDEFRKEVKTEIDAFRTETGVFRKEEQTEMGALRKEIQAGVYEFGTRVTAVETALGLRQELRRQVRIRFLDYSFKAGAIIFLASLSAFFSFLSGLYFHGMLP